jgi:hypothetical protein
VPALERVRALRDAVGDELRRIDPLLRGLHVWHDAAAITQAILAGTAGILATDVARGRVSWFGPGCLENSQQGDDGSEQDDSMDGFHKSFPPKSNSQMRLDLLEN